VLDASVRLAVAAWPLDFEVVERLWTPWRRAFIEGAAANSGPGGCFLCDHAADPGRDRQHFVLARAERVFVLLNLYPYNSGHLMVAPFQHTGDFAHLDSQTATELVRITQRSVDALTRAYSPDAYNVGMNLGRVAGAGLPDHLHVHVVPRWSGDSNFMPIVAQTKVLPETLDQTYERLKPFINIHD
jgi:ATP adenylyltransferase